MKELRKLAMLATASTAKGKLTANPTVILQLLDRLEKAERDAARYQWLKQSPLDWSIEHYRNGWATSYGRTELDAAIDKAMEAK